ncbi:serine/threonine protein kinase-like protein [Ophiobolus disseminans]|uniref:Serine/threonine protein kinase-like protein n=1 Tax=Ophiobolus disseminans TaxID=1469910 RepID=A0A6A7A3N3_9PLEO|nr:serine/threonine protein kinase-like protein [Ophiobolus disseminans]
MTKRKATTPATGAGRRSKRSKLTTSEFVWKPREWKEVKKMNNNVSLLVSNSNRKQRIFIKVMWIKPNRQLPIEIEALGKLPDCNRMIVKPIHYSAATPDPQHGTAFFEPYPLGDLMDWKEAKFDARNWKAVPESYIWRSFLQMSQGLAVLQNQAGPNREERNVLLHRDIKPQNILVSDNGSTYPSFKLHDFGVARDYNKSTARLPSICGSFGWQAPENPTINTRAAGTWALGACIHYLATGDYPLEDADQFRAEVFAENNRHTDSAQAYGQILNYYNARVPRKVTPINLTAEQQREQGVVQFRDGKRCYNHQYSDELNKWMKRCLSMSPGSRPTVLRLVNDMGQEARSMLKKMGGKTALVDMDVKFGTDA